MVLSENILSRFRTRGRNCRACQLHRLTSPQDFLHTASFVSLSRMDAHLNILKWMIWVIYFSKTAYWSTQLETGSSISKNRPCTKRMVPSNFLPTSRRYFQVP